MIGQTELWSRLSQARLNKKFPQFAILVGEEGSGKKLLANKFVSEFWKEHYILPDVSVDTVRKMITQAYRCTGELIYLIPDAHRMSPQAKNALLKVVEEPPKYATFFMTVSYEQSILGTIRSRGTVYHMENYSVADMQQYLILRTRDTQNESYILSVSTNMSDIDKLLKLEINALQKHINTIIDKADMLSLANLLKSSNLIDFKGDDEKKPDLNIFYKAVEYELYMRIKQREHPDTIKMLADMLTATEGFAVDVQNPAINKRYNYESWLYTMRDIEYGYRKS